MKGISDLKIIGIDETRPPYIRKEPYIDIFFKLSHKAPTDWCKDLNNLMAGQKITSHATVNEKDGEFIAAWVRNPDEIITLLETLKLMITECSKQYIAQIQLAAQKSNEANNSHAEYTSEQSNLNRILASLNFEDSVQ